MSRSPSAAEPRDPLRIAVILALIVAALYFGSDVFVPVALSILLSFVLAPGVRFLRRAHIGRVAPVVVMTALAFMIILGLSGVMATQLRSLMSDLPEYQSTISTKIDAARGFLSDGVAGRLREFLTSLSRDVSSAPAPTLSSAAGVNRPTPAPIPVTIRQPDPTPIETLSDLLRPLLHPLATGGIVAVFVVFILLQREDLRHRLIRIVGAGDLHRSTAAIDDAAKRLSRYLLSQLALNTASGFVVAVALWAIGVPTPVLWGILFGCLRFVPYVGPPLAAVMPTLLAAAVSPGWGAAVSTVAMFIVVETVVGQIVEPFVYGHNTGLSPVAVVVAATFWTVLWGPIGLLLSTPMTVCLVVIGRHVEYLDFLDLLLGDRPPLTPPEIFYQRMLADDPIEAADHARRTLRDTDFVAYCDDVVLPGLVLAQDDVALGRLDLERQRRIARATLDVLEDLAEDEEAEPGGRLSPRSIIGRIASLEEPEVRSAAKVRGSEAEAAGLAEPGAVLCLGARGPLEDAAAAVLAQLLHRHGFGARAESYESLLKATIEKADFSGSRLLILSCLDGSLPAFLRFVLRRLRRQAPHAEVLIGAWWRGMDGHGAAGEELEGEQRATTLTEAVAFCMGRASAETPGEDAERAAVAETVS